MQTEGFVPLLRIGKVPKECVDRSLLDWPKTRDRPSLRKHFFASFFDYGTTSSMGGRKPHTGIKNKPTIFSMPMRFFELGFAA